MQVDPYLLVAFSGAPRAGKDTAADYFRQTATGLGYPVKRIVFAEELYRACAALLAGAPQDLNALTPSGRDIYWKSIERNLAALHEDKLRYRPFLKEISDAIKKVRGEHVFLTRTEKLVRDVLLTPSFTSGAEKSGDRLRAIIVSDLRLAMEAEWLHHYGGTEILIRNPVAESAEAVQQAIKDSNPYETRWANMVSFPENFDCADRPLVVFNNSTQYIFKVKLELAFATASKRLPSDLPDIGKFYFE